MPTDGTKLTASQENYLEAIRAVISQRGIARVRDIAEWLGVSTASVSGALKNLTSRKLVQHPPHKYVTLSERGMQIAEKISRRHKTLRTFLKDVLNVTDAVANANAHRIEHALDEIAARRLHYLVEYLSHNPQGRKLAEKFGKFCDREDRTSEDTPRGTNKYSDRHIRHSHRPGRRRDQDQAPATHSRRHQSTRYGATGRESEVNHDR